ncbi:hypothetical protein Zmor_006113 [Zophobas morio]|uniref:DUF4817 domain-containing protein n=1 Tax=Zophobas morio TaxID=2755281 RepID=A0AA38IUE1_9CUCU|nr:hypothetical protein Zmor_006113 [Zophobas morio]
MVLMYGQALGNSLEARRLYQEAFPERRLPNHKTFANVVQRLRENGKFQPRFSDRGRERTERTLDAEEEILNVVENDPGISIRRLSYRVGVSPFVVWRTLHEQGLHPYHVQRVQHLKPEDLPPAEIRAHPEMITRTQQSFIRRAEACIRNGGGHFENFL